MSSLTTAPVRRRGARGPGWVPNQHGAWAMLLAPTLLGALAGGARPVHLLLGLAWLVAYLAFFATGLWLRARRRARYRPPVVAYGTATVVLGSVLIAVEPRLLTWAAVYVPLLVVSLGYSWRRQDRALGNDAVTVVAACLMAVVAYGLGARGAADGGAVPGASSGEAWELAAVLLAYFFGTVLYVKTMIRERHNPAIRRASDAYHAGVAVAAWVAPLAWPVAAVLTLVAVRAVVVPRRWPGTSPRALGLGEIAATTALALTLLL
ncbi:YwiC-like family protein [Cellulomonas sp. APG4]|uniref:YwiC-like family protein n=1 Tax=Cellulomonas sp. APG4 TaxID=1538656 RepID=UPI00351BC47D